MELLPDPCARAGRVLHRVTQRGRGVDRGEYLAAGRFDIPLEALDVPLQRGVSLLFGLHRT